MSFKDYKDIINLIGLTIAIILIQVMLPLFALTTGHGGEEAFNLLKSSLYWGLGIAGIITMWVLKFSEFLSKKNKSIDDKIGWMGTYIHDPEKSPLPNVTGFGWMKSPWKTIIIAIPLFAIFGLIMTYQNTFFSDLPIRQFQQITPLGESILSVEPAGMEIWLPMAIFMGLTSSTYLWLYRRKKIDKTIAYVLIFLTNLVVYPIVWMGYHKLIYGSSQIALNYVLIFGFITALITTLTGSVLWSWAFKDTNNFFQYLNSKYSDEQVLVFTLIFLLLYGIISAFIWIKLNKKKETYEQPIIRS